IDPAKKKTPRRFLSAASSDLLEAELQRTQEVEEILRVGAVQCIELLDDGVRFRSPERGVRSTRMRIDRHTKVLRATVMQQEDALAETPERRGAELITGGLSLAHAVRQARTHVMD